MKLLIIRHADPDYSIDSLTPFGWEEARLLSNRLNQLDVKAFYVSPLGRAKMAYYRCNERGKCSGKIPMGNYGIRPFTGFPWLYCVQRNEERVLLISE